MNSSSRQSKAGFAHYRAIPLAMQQDQDLNQKKLVMPVLVIGGNWVG
jgi:hypothetical protein